LSQTADVRLQPHFIETQTKQYNEVINFIKICIFDALIGNHDRHGRNLAFIETAHKVSLSPMYDNPSYLGIEESSLLGEMHEPYGKIIANNNTPTMRDYILEFKKLGFTEELEALKKLINRRYQEELDVL